MPQPAQDAMPLEIDYRPVKVPPAMVVRRSGVAVPDTGAGPATAASEIGDLREAVARKRALLDAVRKRRSNLRWRIGLVAMLGVLPALLAVLGWGDPRGISGALAQTQTARTQIASAHKPADDGLLAPAAAAAAWDRTLATVHSDADSAPLPAMQSGPAARPTMPVGSVLDRGRALQCLTAAIYYEAAREPDEGQRAVAQVVLNRVAHPAFPKTVCGVVYQGSARPGCQFSFACDGSMARAPMAAYWARARRVAEAALAGNVYAPVGLATHYHTSAVHPTWAEAMNFLGTIGAHRFYRWNGNAGSPRAFNAVYAGGEPVAAPHPHTWISTGADFADPLVLQKAFEAGRLAALRANPAPPGTDPAIVRAGASFGQQTLSHSATPTADPATRGSHILPGSGAVRPEAEQQYDSAAHWIRQPGA